MPPVKRVKVEPVVIQAIKVESEPKPAKAKVVEPEEPPTLPLTERYRPTQEFQLLGNHKARRKFNYWLKTRNTPSVLLSGPPGVGKTTAAHVFLTQHKYKVYEVNASEVRVGTTLVNQIRNLNLTCTGDDMEPYAVIVDEVDGIYDPVDNDSTTQSSIDCLVQYIQSLPCGKKLPPVVFICNERWSKTMRKLASVCEHIPFYPLSNYDMEGIYKGVLRMEGNRIFPDEVKKQYITQSEGDARKLLNLLHVDLYNGSAACPRLTPTSTSKQMGMFDVCDYILQPGHVSRSMTELSQVYESNDSTMLMLHENYLCHRPWESQCSSEEHSMTQTPETRCPKCPTYVSYLDDMSQMMDTLSELDLTGNRYYTDDILPFEAYCYGKRPISERSRRHQFPLSLSFLKKRREKKRMHRCIETQMEQVTFESYFYPENDPMFDLVTCVEGLGDSVDIVDTLTPYGIVSTVDDIHKHPRFILDGEQFVYILPGDKDNQDMKFIQRGKGHHLEPEHMISSICFEDSVSRLQRLDLILIYLLHWQNTVDYNRTGRDVTFFYGHITDEGEVVNYPFTPFDLYQIDEIVNSLKQLQVTPDMVVPLFGEYSFKLRSDFLADIEKKLQPPPPPKTKKRSTRRKEHLSNLLAAMKQQLRQ